MAAPKFPVYTVRTYVHPPRTYVPYLTRIIKRDLHSLSSTSQANTVQRDPNNPSQPGAFSTSTVVSLHRLASN